MMGTFSKSFASMRRLHRRPTSVVIDYMKHHSRPEPHLLRQHAALRGGDGARRARHHPIGTGASRTTLEDHSQACSTASPRWGTTSAHPSHAHHARSSSDDRTRRPSLSGVRSSTRASSRTPSSRRPCRRPRVGLRTSYIATHTDDQLDYVLETTRRRPARQLGILIVISRLSGDGRMMHGHRRGAGSFARFRLGPRAKALRHVPVEDLRGEISSWVPPLMQRGARSSSTPKHNPFFEHAEVEHFLAWRGDDPDRAHRGHPQPATQRVSRTTAWGFFGLFECIDDDTVAWRRDCSTTAARVARRARTSTTIRGPMSYSTNETCGLFVDGDAPDRRTS